MKNRNKKKGRILFFLCIIIGIVFIIWVMNPENFREVKDKIRMSSFGSHTEDSYNAKSLILVDLSNDENFISKNRMNSNYLLV